MKVNPQLSERNIQEVRERWEARGGVPGWKKWLIGIAILYQLFPIDAIPDALPVVGTVDDLLMIYLPIGIQQIIDLPKVKVWWLNRQLRRGKLTV